MQKLFSYRFSQHIWTIIPDSDPESSLWAIELRDAQLREVSYAVLDAQENRIRWHNTPMEADWNTSMIGFSSGHIFLHKFRFQDIPEPTDLVMISAESGETQWLLPNHTLVNTFANSMIKVGQRIGDGFKNSFRHASSGLPLTTFDVNDMAFHEVILKEPVRYVEGDVYFDRLSAFIIKMTGGHKPVCIDYVDKRPVMIFSYYIYEQEKTSEFLLLVSDKLELMHHELLADHREGIGRSTFFLKGLHLVYLKNNSEISILTI